MPFIPALKGGAFWHIVVTVEIKKDSVITPKNKVRSHLGCIQEEAVARWR
jgi:hypothetical protein